MSLFSVCPIYKNLIKNHINRLNEGFFQVMRAYQRIMKILDIVFEKTFAHYVLKPEFISKNRCLT